MILSLSQERVKWVLPQCLSWRFFWKEGWQLSKTWPEMSSYTQEASGLTCSVCFSPENTKASRAFNISQFFSSTLLLRVWPQPSKGEWWCPADVCRHSECRENTQFQYLGWMKKDVNILSFIQLLKWPLSHSILWKFSYFKNYRFILKFLYRTFWQL